MSRATQAGPRSCEGFIGRIGRPTSTLSPAASFCIPASPRQQRVMVSDTAVAYSDSLGRLW